MSEDLPNEARKHVRTVLAIPLFMALVGAVASLGWGLVHLGQPGGWGVLAAGITLSFCCVGLWNAREWARWLCASIFVVMFVAGIRLPQRVTGYVNLSLVLLSSVYLVLPSTGRLFARARALDPKDRGGRAER